MFQAVCAVRTAWNVLEMSLYLVLVAAFVLLLLALLFIPLPNGIADKRKLYPVEILFRITTEYLGEIVEDLLGPRWRNSFMRLVMALGFYLPFPRDSSIEFSWTQLGGVPVRLLRPLDPAKRSSSAVIYIHGGGFCTMRPQYYDFALSRIVRKLGCSVFSVDYRLAPESPYPAALDDCIAVIMDLFHGGRVKEFGVERSRVALMGDSAGGNLSAVLSRRLRKDNFIKCQVLIYPVTTVFGFSLNSYREYAQNLAGTALLNPAGTARWILFYLGMDASAKNVKKMVGAAHVPRGASSLLDEMIAAAEKGREEKKKKAESEDDQRLQAEFAKRALDPDVSPLHAPDVDGLPPTMVLTAGFDILRDEGQLYAHRLSSAGNDVTSRHYPFAYHGILNMPYSATKAQMQRDIIAFLEKRL